MLQQLLVLLIATSLYYNTTAHASNLSTLEINENTESRARLIKLAETGNFIELAKLSISRIENGHNKLDGVPPSAYFYLGISHFKLNRLADSSIAFARAVHTYDNDLMGWLALGESYLCQFEILKACWAFEQALIEKRLTNDTSKLYKARSWIADWTDREYMHDQLRHSIRETMRTNISDSNNIQAADFVEFDGKTLLHITKTSLKNFPLATEQKFQPTTTSAALTSFRRLKIGFLTSDLGVHPVSSLIRGMITTFNPNQFEVYCFTMTDETSWWQVNITQTLIQSKVHHVVSLAGKSPEEAAEIIKSYGVNVAIDLNGLTLNSGLPVLSFRPAQVQLSFLGYPMTTGADFIDYFVTDCVTTPPEHADHFSERLLYMPGNYLVNDHLQLLGHVHSLPRPTSVEANINSVVVKPTTFVYAVFSNWQKMDPTTFSAWMQILQQVPDSVLWFLQYKGHEAAVNNLRLEAYAHGVDFNSRVVVTPQVAWINHTWVKSAADVVLDTTLKNGHTTMLDALWGGIPMVTLSGDKTLNRVASSMASTLEMSDVMTAYSMKEYVDLAVSLRQHSTRVRSKLLHQRVNTPLFDTRKWTRYFESAIQTVWDYAVAPKTENRPWHVLQTPWENKKDTYPLLPVTLDTATVKSSAITEAVATDTPILLNIGGKEQKSGWWIVDAIDDKHVDYVLNMKNLSVFPTHSVSGIYCSHALEHVPYGKLNGDNSSDLSRVLAEWKRVLVPGGKVYVSVPDMGTLASLYVNATDVNDRFYIMRMIYGGQIDEFDFHYVGFDTDILTAYLQQAGFCDFVKVDSFNLFDDTSTMLYKNKYPISLNIMATSCEEK